jgi:SNARE associated Golgi protein
VGITAAAIIGDSIGYELGRHLGRNWLLRYGRWIGVSQSHLEKVDRYFQLHGGKSVFFSHFMHLLRGLMSFLAGSSRMRYPPFLFLMGWLYPVGNPVHATGLFLRRELEGCRKMDRTSCCHHRRVAGRGAGCGAVELQQRDGGRPQLRGQGRL